jgi:hypothetical protein
MKPRTSIALAAGCAAGLAIVTLSHAASAAEHEQCPNTEIMGNPPVYFPYPPGLIPPDLCSEVKRCNAKWTSAPRRFRWVCALRNGLLNRILRITA